MVYWDPSCERLFAFIQNKGFVDVGVESVTLEIKDKMDMAGLQLVNMPSVRGGNKRFRYYHVGWDNRIQISRTISGGRHGFLKWVGNVGGNWGNVREWR